MRYCSGCSHPIPDARLKVLPTAETCVKCSSEEKWGAIHIVNHKTGNDVQVMKDAESARKFAKLTARAGFGTLRGLRAGANSKDKKSVPMVSKSLSASPEFYEKVGARMLEVLDLLGEERARQFINTQVKERAICSIQGSRLTKILNELTAKEAPKPMIKKKKEVYNPYGKFEPFEAKDSFSKEIEDSFKYWKK